MNLFDIETWEMWSYVVTVFGLPLAIGVFLYEQRRERQGEEEEIFQYLSEEYAEFQKLVLENADLGLTTDAARQLDAARMGAGVPGHRRQRRGSAGARSRHRRGERVPAAGHEAGVLAARHPRRDVRHRARFRGECRAGAAPRGARRTP